MDKIFDIKKISGIPGGSYGGNCFLIFSFSLFSKDRSKCRADGRYELEISDLINGYSILATLGVHLY